MYKQKVKSSLMVFVVSALSFQNMYSAPHDDLRSMSRQTRRIALARAAHEDKMVAGSSASGVTTMYGKSLVASLVIIALLVPQTGATQIVCNSYGCGPAGDPWSAAQFGKGVSGETPTYHETKPFVYNPAPLPESKAHNPYPSYDPMKNKYTDPYTGKLIK